MAACGGVWGGGEGEWRDRSSRERSGGGGGGVDAWASRRTDAGGMRKDEDIGDERSRRNGDWCRRWSGLVALIAAARRRRSRNPSDTIDCLNVALGLSSKKTTRAKG